MFSADAEMICERGEYCIADKEQKGGRPHPAPQIKKTKKVEKKTKNTPHKNPKK